MSHCVPPNGEPHVSPYTENGLWLVTCNELWVKTNVVDVDDLREFDRSLT